MHLCTKCQSVDYGALAIADLQECKDRQEVIRNGINYEPEKSQEKYKHHDDIYDVQKSARDCILCKEIFDAFLKREIEKPEEAKGLPIVFRSCGARLEVCYDTPEGLIRLCGFDRYMTRHHVDAIFKYCGIKEDHSPPILKIMNGNPASEASLGVALAWLKNCVSSHTRCKPSLQLQYPPKRLINVGYQNHDPFLEEIDPTSVGTEWVSLSYCWGERRLMVLTTQTIGELRNGTFQLKAFDPAVRDAIIVTRALNITYLWIDALCILQDDNGADWREQAPKMKQIYGGSASTLVSSSSDSAMNGFLEERPQRYIDVPLSPDTQDHQPVKWSLSPEWDKSEDEIAGHWSTRGWTMQEGLLPNRLLHFRSSQMVWECCEERAFERGVTERLQDTLDTMILYNDDAAYSPGLPQKLGMFIKFKRMPDCLPVNMDSTSLSTTECFQLWYELIENYVPRRFSRISDRLVAISSLAQAFSEMIPCQEYVAGLWQADLIRGLMWYTKDSPLIQRRYEEISNAKDYFSPSWSWTSVGYDHIIIPYKNNDGHRPLSRIHDVDIEFVDKSQPFGTVTSGKVTISGPLKELSRLYYQKWKAESDSITKLEHHLSKLIEDESTGTVEPRYSSCSGRHFAALQMIKDYDKIELLILESTGTTSNGFNEYRRVGVVTLHYFPSAPLASPEFLSMLAKYDNSLASRLGPRRNSSPEVMGSNAVVEELRNEKWKIKTVVLI